MFSGIIISISIVFGVDVSNIFCDMSHIVESGFLSEFFFSFFKLLGAYSKQCFGKTQVFSIVTPYINFGTKRF